MKSTSVNEPHTLGVSQFVAVLNQSLEVNFGRVKIVGELANLRISKDRWLYFDLKDESATLKFFGTVYLLPGPLEDGMMLEVEGLPRLHSVYGFSVNVSKIRVAGEGSIKRAAELLKRQLAAEGLFDETRKRPLPYPPARLGLVCSLQSAAYADFVKVLQARWRGLEIEVLDVLVQGEAAPAQIVAALEQYNARAQPPEVLVIIRGGGSAEDLAAFNSESVTRAVAASRVPTLAAIGHETDLSLAELAADRRASTPSNAAELLVPDRAQVGHELKAILGHLDNFALNTLRSEQQSFEHVKTQLDDSLEVKIGAQQLYIDSTVALLGALNPKMVLRRGYAIVRSDGRVIRDSTRLKANSLVSVELAKGKFEAEVTAKGM